MNINFKNNILRNLTLFINSVITLLYIHFHVILAVYILLIIKPSIKWYRLFFEMELY